MLFAAGYASAFAACVLLALCRSRHAAAIWPQVRPVPRRWVFGMGAIVSLGLTLSCMLAVEGYDAAMAVIATLCLTVLAAIGMTLLLGFWPQRLLPAAGVGLVLALLTVGLQLGATP